VFRNALFHDSSVKKASFKATKFCAHPAYANEIDLMESVRVAVNVFHCFRYLLPGCDLMPNILVVEGWEKFDMLAKQYLFPTFAQILRAKGLREVPFGPVAEILVPAVPGPRMGIAIKHEAIWAPIDADCSDIAIRNFEPFRNQWPSAETFTLPNYMTWTPSIGSIASFRPNCRVGWRHEN
jgi:hypothetical protein